MKKLIWLALLPPMTAFANEKPEIFIDFPFNAPIVENETYTFNVWATDPDGDALTDIEIHRQLGEIISFDGQTVVWKFTSSQFGNTHMLDFSVSERTGPEPLRAFTTFGSGQNPLFLECDIQIFQQLFKDQLDHYGVKPQGYKSHIDQILRATSEAAVKRSVEWLSASVLNKGWGARNLTGDERADLWAFTTSMHELGNYMVTGTGVPRSSVGGITNQFCK